MEKEHSGVIEKVKFLVSGGGPKQIFPISGLNLPWLLARCDCAYREMVPLLRGSIFVKEYRERCEYYVMLLEMVRDILDSLDMIYKETLRFSAGRKVEPDSSVSVLQVILQSLQVLYQASVLSVELQSRQAAADTFAGSGVIAKFNGFEDSVSNVEVELLHHISELIDSVSPAMQRASEQRKKSLSRNGMECYLRAEKALTLYYSGLSRKN